MKKFMLTAALFLLGVSAFCQEEKNGTIYIKHPYIDVVNNVVKAYTAQDFEKMKSYFADTATYWQPGMEKFAPFAEAIKAWKNDQNYLTDFSMTPIGYPDYLHYKKEDAKIVQSWWNWSVKSKKTGETIKVPMVLFVEFNNDGKIARQYIFGDFSKAQAEEM